MAINPNIPTEVLAGEPVTAEAWNVIVKAIVALTDYLSSTEASSLQVTITNPGIIPSAARVTAFRDNVTFQAVAPVPPGTSFVFSGLRPGPYTLRAESAGFDAATQSITLPAAAPVSMTLTPHGAFMPALFGLTLQGALQLLQNLNIHVSQIVDVVGRDVAPANPGAEYTSSPVLVQFPAPGAPVPPEASAQLVVATSLQVQASIEMPSLAGLTVAEAQRALEGIGLVLGKVDTRGPALPGPRPAPGPLPVPTESIT